MRAEVLEKYKKWPLDVWTHIASFCDTLDSVFFGATCNHARYATYSTDNVFDKYSKNYYTLQYPVGPAVYSKWYDDNKFLLKNFYRPTISDLVTQKITIPSSARFGSYILTMASTISRIGNRSNWKLNCILTDSSESNIAYFKPMVNFKHLEGIPHSADKNPIKTVTFEIKSSDEHKGIRMRFGPDVNMMLQEYSKYNATAIINSVMMEIPSSEIIVFPFICVGYRYEGSPIEPAMTFFSPDRPVRTWPSRIEFTVDTKYLGEGILYSHRVMIKYVELIIKWLVHAQVPTSTCVNFRISNYCDFTFERSKDPNFDYNAIGIDEVIDLLREEPGDTHKYTKYRITSDLYMNYMTKFTHVLVSNWSVIISRLLGDIYHQTKDLNIRYYLNFTVAPGFSPTLEESMDGQVDNMHFMLLDFKTKVFPHDKFPVLAIKEFKRVMMRDFTPTEYTTLYDELAPVSDLFTHFRIWDTQRGTGLLVTKVDASDPNSHINQNENEQQKTMLSVILGVSPIQFNQMPASLIKVLIQMIFLLADPNLEIASYESNLARTVAIVSKMLKIPTDYVEQRLRGTRDSSSSQINESLDIHHHDVTVGVSRSDLFMMANIKNFSYTLWKAPVFKFFIDLAHKEALNYKTIIDIKMYSISIDDTSSGTSGLSLTLPPNTRQIHTRKNMFEIMKLMVMHSAKVLNVENSRVNISFSARIE